MSSDPEYSLIADADTAADGRRERRNEEFAVEVALGDRRELAGKQVLAVV